MLMTALLLACMVQESTGLTFRRVSTAAGVIEENPWWQKDWRQIARKTWKMHRPTITKGLNHAVNYAVNHIIGDPAKDASEKAPKDDLAKDASEKAPSQQAPAGAVPKETNNADDGTSTSPNKGEEGGATTSEAVHDEDEVAETKEGADQGTTTKTAASDGGATTSEAVHGGDATSESPQSSDAEEGADQGSTRKTAASDGPAEA